MSFEGGAPFEHNLYSSGIPRMNFVSLTERMSWEAECQILHHQLIDSAVSQKKKLIDSARISSQLIIQNAALEREFFPSCGISKC